MLPAAPAFDGVVPTPPEARPADIRIARRLLEITGWRGPVLTLLTMRPPSQGLYRIGPDDAGLFAKIVDTARSIALAKADRLIADLGPAAPVVRPMDGYPVDYDDLHKLHVYPLVHGRFAQPTMSDCYRVGVAIARLHRALADVPRAAEVRAAAGARQAHLMSVAEAIADGRLNPGPRPAELANIARFRWDTGEDDAQPLHGDLNAGNLLLVDEGTDVIVDFEDSVHSCGPVEADVAFAIERFCIAPAPDEASSVTLSRALVAGYRSAGGQPVFERPGELAAALRAANWRALMVLGALAARGETRPVTEWEKFFDLWSQVERRRGLLAEIEAAVTRRAMVAPGAPRLLLSARDPNAAAQVIALVEANREFDWFDAIVVADPPAYDRLVSAGIDASAGPAIAATDGHDAGALLEAARRIVADADPDMVVTGLSGPDAGIDEALLAVAPVPTMALQDFWGDVNRTLGTAAGCYAVTDTRARALTAVKTGAETVVAGQAKYRRFLDRPVAERIGAARAALGTAAGQRLVVFAGQPLWTAPGYADILSSVASALAAASPIAGPPARLIYRPHPKEAPGDIDLARAAVEAGGLVFEMDLRLDIVDLVAAADILVTCFSQTAYDKIMLNRLSPVPAGVALYVLPPEMMATYRRMTSLDGLPPHEQGLAPCATTHDGIGAALADAALPDTAHRYWRVAHESLPDPAHAPQRILMAAFDQLGRSAASRRAKDPVSG